MKALKVSPQTKEANNLVSNVHVNYSKARRAYEKGDIEASRALHSNPEQGSHDKNYRFMGSTVKSLIVGGLDGILTSFAIIAGAAGGGLGPDVILILGFSNILANALSMGLGEFLSSKAHNEFVLSERRREEWELLNNKEGQVNEMTQIYIQRGMSNEDAEEISKRLAKYDDMFVNTVMAEGLGMPVNNIEELTNSCETAIEGLVTFCSFAGFGTLPLIVYCVLPRVGSAVSEQDKFGIATLITAVFLFILGVIKSQFSSRSWFCSGMESMILGGCCAGLAYEIGDIVHAVLNT